MLAPSSAWNILLGETDLKMYDHVKKLKNSVAILPNLHKKVLSLHTLEVYLLPAICMTA